MEHAGDPQVADGIEASIRRNRGRGTCRPFPGDDHHVGLGTTVLRAVPSWTAGSSRQPPMTVLAGWIC